MSESTTMTNPCDKCRGDVPKVNSALHLMHAMGESAMIFVAFTDRHFLPVVDDNGAILCPGSPSRAQYIEGQERDTRPDSVYNPARETEIRAAYQILLDEEEKADAA